MGKTIKVEAQDMLPPQMFWRICESRGLCLKEMPLSPVLRMVEMAEGGHQGKKVNESGHELHKA